MPGLVPVTTRSIAKEAGLSHATVSLILNQRGDELGIKPETQRRVREIAKRLNYIRNPLATGLKGGRTKMVGVLWSLGGPHNSEGMTRRIAMRVQRRGYMTHLADHLSQHSVICQLLADLARRRVDAVVLQDGGGDLPQTPEILELLKNFPAAVVVSIQPWDAPCDQIVHDRLAAYDEAVDHFAAIGRRRPGILIPVSSSRDKIDTFLKRARQHGLAVSQASVIDVQANQGEKLTTTYHRALQSLEQADFPFDALLCSTDEGAVVAMSWLRSRGLRVPEDVALSGFNDSLIAEYLHPPLASIDRSDEPVADAIESLIFNRLSDPTLPPQRTQIPMRFVWRESAGRLPEVNS